MRFYYVIIFSAIFLLAKQSCLAVDYGNDSVFQISVFDDPSNRMLVDEVKAILNDSPNQFIPSEKMQEPFNPDKTYWLYLQRLDTNCNKVYVLTFSMWLSLIEVYPSPYSLVAGYGGRMVNGNLKDLPDCSVFLGAGVGGYLIKVQNRVYSKVSVKSLQVLPAHIFQKKKERLDFTQGLLQGFFWLMLFYSLLLYLVMRKSIHLFYFFYILLNSMYLLFFFGYSEVFLFPDNYKLNILLFTFQPIGLFFYVMFIRQMLLSHCFAYTSAIDRKTLHLYAYVLLFVNLFIASAILFRIDIFISVSRISNLINCIVGVVTLTYFYKKSDDLLHIVMVGSYIMIFFGLIGIIYVPIDLYTDNLFFEIGLLIELLLFTYAMNRQYSRNIEERYETELAKLELKRELDDKNRELVYQAIQLSAREAVILSIKGEIRNSKISKGVDPGIEPNDLVNKNLWKEFELHFNETHPAFYKGLIEKYPELTHNEIRLCAFLRLNLNTKEIAMITLKSVHSIEAMRSRIRQKMQLERDANLNLILAQLS